jgi:hypothetical protein
MLLDNLDLVGRLSEVAGNLVGGYETWLSLELIRGR